MQAAHAAPALRSRCSLRSVTSSASLRFVAVSRARRDQTGGDPAAPGWVAAGSQLRQVGGRPTTPGVALVSALDETGVWFGTLRFT